MNLLTDYQDIALSQKHLLCLQDYTPDEILGILSKALQIKKEWKSDQASNLLQNKTLAMIFSKNSTRTRVSFEVGMLQLGGKAIVLNQADIHLGGSESVADTARVLSRFVDGIMIRTFKQSDVADLAQYGSIPVINGLTDDFHPCQALADILTVYEHKNQIKGLKLAFVGDGNNVANSLMIICSKLGIDFAIGCPQGYEPRKDVLDWARENAKAAGSTVLVTNDPAEAVKGSDAVYTDIWASMGQEAETAKRMEAFKGYQVNMALFSQAKPDALFLHCLPAHRNHEVTDEVIDSPNSVVFDEAENRLHAQKAVLAMLLGGK
jgi:ornithine carbamoyltransferase